jgi:hypothetical protein
MSLKPRRRSEAAECAESAALGGYDYANQFEVGFSRDEVLLSLAQAYEGVSARTRQMRVVMTPAYAKALLLLLSESIARYETEYGEVLAAGAGVAPADDRH